MLRPADLRSDSSPGEPNGAADGPSARPHQELLQSQQRAPLPLRPPFPQGPQGQGKRVQGKKKIVK